MVGFALISLEIICLYSIYSGKNLTEAGYSLILLENSCFLLLEDICLNLAFSGKYLLNLAG